MKEGFMKSQFKGIFPLALSKNCSIMQHFSISIYIPTSLFLMLLNNEMLMRRHQREVFDIENGNYFNST